MLRRAALLAAVFATTIVVTVPAAASYLVVRSSGPSARSYPLGMKLSDDAKVGLGAGDSLTVVGRTTARHLEGPGTFLVGGREHVRARASRRSRFGARRGRSLPDTPWMLDVTRSAQVCVSTEHQLYLWRRTEDHQSAATLTVQDGRSQTLTWPTGVSAIPWPSQFPLKEGYKYQVQLSDRREPTQLSIIIVPAVGPQLAATAKALIDRGCNAQLDILVDHALAL